MAAIEHLRGKDVRYTALDGNGRMVAAARRAGLDARLWDARTDAIPEADVVVLSSSLYHFHAQAPALLQRLRRAARRLVLVSEPVQNLSAHPLGPVRALATWLSDPGMETQGAAGSSHTFRYDLTSFRDLADRAGARSFLHPEGARNALAVFETG